MSYKQWLDLFGRNIDDESVRDALVKVGIDTSALEVEKDDISVVKNVSGKGITLVFSDEAYLHKRDDMAIGEGAPILSEFSLWLQESEDGSVYTGPLPFNLQRDNSRVELRKQFGEPVSSDDDPPWDQWSVDNLVLTVEYNEDEKSLSTVSLELVV